MKSKLQEEILQAIQTGDGILDDSRAYHASQIALRWIEKAFEAGREYEKDHIWMDKFDATNYQQWLKENNLIEKQ